MKSISFALLFVATTIAISSSVFVQAAEEFRLENPDSPYPSLLLSQKSPESEWETVCSSDYSAGLYFDSNTKASMCKIVGYSEYLYNSNMIEVDASTVTNYSTSNYLAIHCPSSTGFASKCRTKYLNSCPSGKIVALSCSGLRTGSGGSGVTSDGKYYFRMIYSSRRLEVREAFHAADTIESWKLFCNDGLTRETAVGICSSVFGLKGTTSNFFRTNSAVLSYSASSYLRARTPQKFQFDDVNCPAGASTTNFSSNCTFRMNPLSCGTSEAVSLFCADALNEAKLVGKYWVKMMKDGHVKVAYYTTYLRVPVLYHLCYYSSYRTNYLNFLYAASNGTRCPGTVRQLGQLVDPEGVFYSSYFPYYCSSSSANFADCTGSKRCSSSLSQEYQLRLYCVPAVLSVGGTYAPGITTRSPGLDVTTRTPASRYRLSAGSNVNVIFSVFILFVLTLLN